MKQNSLFDLTKKIVKLESFPGILLLFATILALLLANTDTTKDIYNNLLHVNFLSLSTHQWVNDVLMALFFLSIGLEVKRELLIGNLSNFKSAAFPVIAAFGGMIVPALIFTLFTLNTAFTKGFGIPMATDIAFALGVLLLLGKRVPNDLKVFLLTLAVVDDLGAIVVIALFYSKGLILTNLALAFFVLLALFILNKMGIKNLIFYFIGGVFLWYFVHESGIHATIAGVLFAFCIPLRIKGGVKLSPLVKLEHKLSPFSSYFIMPIFALFNAGVVLSGNIEFNVLSLGIIFGLLFGKPIGILAFTFISVKLGMANKPSILNWNHIFAVGILAGIGFTMSIFISSLSFDGLLLDNAKISVLIGSLLAGVIGSLYFKFFVFKKG
ncbi:MAG: Na+/H+ antiporter NhaA [Campylobacteraceae bacterium]